VVKAGIGPGVDESLEPSLEPLAHAVGDETTLT
jgi:hypothetical protein